jgi:hypothetical protein
VVIFPGTYLADVKALDGKAVEIKGMIKNYHGNPEIVLDNTDQLTVLGLPASTNVPATSQPTNAPPPSTGSTNFPEIM